MNRAIFLASRNAHKIVELTRIAPDVRWLLLPEELGDPPETGATFEANALEKARFAAAWACAQGDGGPVSCLADDSGLEVDALGGRPGVWSKRYSPEGTDAANNALLLRELAETPDSQRTARYRCVIALIECPVVGPAGGAFEGWVERVFVGRCEGSIGHVARGNGGFGYDPLFIPVARSGRAMAELAPDEKDAISHRGAALRALIAGLG
ncbi:MAG: non-canonical purine NTP pyrophosphatase [Myxococcales bacterium]|nr:non-canonical purine NTP pyrophosphatase [Myxococcales bacterium]